LFQKGKEEISLAIEVGGLPSPPKKRRSRGEGIGSQRRKKKSISASGRGRSFLCVRLREGPRRGQKKKGDLPALIGKEKERLKNESDNKK